MKYLIAFKITATSPRWKDIEIITSSYEHFDEELTEEALNEICMKLASRIKSDSKDIYEPRGRTGAWGVEERDVSVKMLSVTPIEEREKEDE